MKKTTINSIKVTYLIPLVLILFIALPVKANEDPDPEGLPPDPAAPISDYWWVLILVAVLYVWKIYFKNQAKALPKE